MDHPSKEGFIETSVDCATVTGGNFCFTLQHTECTSSDCSMKDKNCLTKGFMDMLAGLFEGVTFAEGCYYHKGTNAHMCLCSEDECNTDEWFTNAIKRPAIII